TIMSRRLFTVCALATALYAAPAHADRSSVAQGETQTQVQVEVWKTPACGCCVTWVEHMEQNGFTVAAHNTAYGMLRRIKRQADIPEAHASCHTAMVGGYALEGHVPAADVRRLLDENPEAVGLAVPGM